MNLWLAAFVSLLCALAGAGLGWWFSRQRSPYCMIGYFIPAVLMVVFIVAFYVPALLFTPPVSWLMMGLKKFAVFGFIASMILTTALSRLSKGRDRSMVCLLMSAIVFYMAIWPFLAPAVDRKQLAGLKTSLDDNGICLQTTDHTCGPASAVTALRKLGLPADEGQMAILSCTSFQEGTPPDLLADAMQREYGKDGLAVKCRAFKNIAELKQAGLTLAVVKYGFMVDHWVTVLEVTDSEVVIGDPLGGLGRMSYDEFLKRWRFIGIVMQRNG
ncbi:MAG TPA: cysteine peptidase family C39 domain-containing protein [Verrucomicrobiae bacterium]|nr:cysteine peptidase family C39 domain-containing protein [Verrucomicrobiae bacterium]